MGQDIPVIPQPVKVSLAEGSFEFDAETVVCCESGYGIENVAKVLCDYIGCENGVIDCSGTECTNSICFKLNKDLPFESEEGYCLSIDSSRIVVTAKALNGLFYGIQTLKQLMPASMISTKLSEFSLPCLEITDYPRFKWRGMHLDTARHIYPVSMVKSYIDMLAFNKMNKFHWHLTEDQGWRIEIKKYPKLTEISSERAATPVLGDRESLDGIPYSGFYTQEEAREIVKYAADRFITVVPEIELPGHSVEVLAAYPNLGCTGGPYEVRCFWGIEKDVYCAGNPDVFEFLQDVFDEILEIFPSEYIHIGGDECPKERWKECPKCQATIKENNLKDELGLQSWFIQKVEQYLNSKGRNMIGWDEILEGGLAPNATVMVWRNDGMKDAVFAANSGNDVIMSPGSHCYFDHYQDKPENEPPAIGGFLPLEKVYAFNPMPPELSKDKQKHIIGGQANVWSEYMPTVEQAQYMSYPRAFAIAEKLWSTEDVNDFDNFKVRLPNILKHLDELGINYRKL
ncbi:MAG: beta-N-acetylhexosaminidase [Kiritimatiellae bacterium]|jgi:hexosaminidase|nr:beta-N-acetylhexosaminidase [Kiritimatiellia bacterium]